MASSLETRLQHVESELEGLRADVAGELSAQLDGIAAELSQNKFNQDMNWAMWVPAIQQALDKANAAQDNLQKIQMDWPMRCVVGADNSITFQHEELNFTVKAASTTTVWVRGGTWERNGYPLAMVCETVPTAQPYKILTVSSDGTYYVYLQLASATYDPSLRPQTLTVEISQTIPDNTATLNLYKILCTVEVSGGVIVANGIVPQYYGGDYRDFFAIPDSESSYDAASAKRYFSLEKSPRSGRHSATDQIKDFDDASNVAPETDDLMMYRHSEGAGVDEYFVVRYCTPSALIGSGFVPPVSPAPWSPPWDLIDTWLNTYHVIDHTNLDFSGSTAPTGTGKSGENTDHDDTYHHVYTVTNAFIDTKSWRTTGNYWMASLHLSANGTTDTFAANPNSITTLGKLDMTIAATSAWAITGDLTASADNSNIFPRVHNAGLLQIGSSSYVWANVFSYFKTYMNLNGMTTGTMVFSNLAGFDVNGDSGKTISGWTTLGVLTGTAIIEINQGDLRTTDKILVRR